MNLIVSFFSFIWIMLLDSVHCILEPWSVIVKRARDELECETFCNEEPVCRTWVYKIDNSECRLNQYVEAARNIYVARDKNINYISGLKQGKKRLRKVWGFILCYYYYYY
jgi:hypothetical protein